MFRSRTATGRCFRNKIEGSGVLILERYDCSRRVSWRRTGHAAITDTTLIGRQFGPAGHGQLRIRGHGRHPRQDADVCRACCIAWDSAGRSAGPYPGSRKGREPTTAMRGRRGRDDRNRSKIHAVDRRASISNTKTIRCHGSVGCLPVASVGHDGWRRPCLVQGGLRRRRLVRQAVARGAGKPSREQGFFKQGIR